MILHCSINKQKSSARKQYSPEDLERAIEEAQKTGKMRRSAEKFRVPFSTVQRYIQSPPKNIKPGPVTVLSASEEGRIKTWVLYMSRAGFPMSETDLYHAVMDYAETIRKKRDIPKTFPCKFALIIKCFPTQISLLQQFQYHRIV